MSVTVLTTKKNVIGGLGDETAIIEMEIPTTAILASTPELIELGVGVEEYGLLIFPADAGTNATTETVKLISDGAEYIAPFASILSADVGDPIGFSDDGK